MTKVFQAEYVGDLAPYSYEKARLGDAGIELDVAVCADGAELVERARDAEIVWLEWRPLLTREVLEQLDRCELVVRWGIGYDQIDAQAATELGIAVANAPTYCRADVVEHTIGLLLALTRRIPERNASMHSGGWRTPTVERRRLAGRTIGVIGLGGIGRQVAAIAAMFGCRVLGCDVRPVEPEIDGVSIVGFEELLASSDVVCAHASLDDRSRHLIDDEAIGLMKDDAILVNTSRGPIVDEAALLRALEAGKFFGVALDVFETEPLPADSPLRSFPRVLLTPHEAASSPESFAELRRQVCDATIDWARTGWTDAVVNPGVVSRRGATRPLA